MRFRSITLRRYGYFERRDLDMSQAQGLTVVFGPNEAGKSTLLSAVVDFLFGIPERSSHGERFGNDQIQIGAQILLSDGTSYSYRRNKARGAKALTDENGQTANAAVLNGALAGVSREKFEALFGLDHVLLRTGGENLLAADGEVGKLIVEAGGGLRLLVERLNELEDEASRIFSSRRSAERKFYQASDAFGAADKKVKTSSLNYDDFRSTKRTVESERQTLNASREKRTDARTRLSVLERLFRTAPMLRDLAEFEARGADLQDVSRLDRGFPQRGIEIIRKHDAAKQANETAAAELKRLETEHAAISFNKAFFDDEVRVRTMETKAVHVDRERGDKSKREAELHASLAKLETLRDLLGAKPDADLRSIAPSPLVLSKVRDVAEQAADIQRDIRQTDRQIVDLCNKIKSNDMLQSERRKGGADRLVVVDDGRIAQLLQRESEAQRAAADLAGRTTRIATLCCELDVKDARTLQSQLWPTIATIDAAINQQAKTQRELEAAHTERKVTARKIGEAKRVLQRVKGEGELPTVSAIAGARALRDSEWATIRGVFLDPNSPASQEADSEWRMGKVSEFEGSQAQADRLADRKGDEAQRIAEVARAQQDLSEYQLIEQTLSQTILELTKEADDFLTAWAARWPAVADFANRLEVCRALTMKRDATLKEIDDLTSRQEKLEAIEADLQAAREALSAAEASLGCRGDADTLSSRNRIQKVSSRLAEHKEAHTEYRSLEIALRDQRLELRTAESALVQLRADQEECMQSWRGLMPAIGLASDADLQTGRDVATAWSNADGVFDTIAITERRLNRMAEEETELVKLVTEVAKGAGVDVPQDPIAASQMLSDRWRQASARAQARSKIEEAMSSANVLLETTSASLTSASMELDALYLEGHCTPETLRPTIERCTSAHQLADRIEQTRETLRAASDGISRAQLETELAGRSMDTLQALIDQAREAIDTLDARIEAEAGSLRDAERTLTEMMTINEASAAIAARESAAADLERFSMRYVELTLARKILEAAIERVRKEQQDPLVLRASQLFAIATIGEFQGIETDIDEDGEPVVIGVRQDGSPVRVAGMSDGTRDQLYLAFRLASLELYAKSAEPLPFVADDILVHFDDARSAATLHLLSEFGKNSQVILFTHHRAVRDVAQTLADQGLATVIDLA